MVSFYWIINYNIMANIGEIVAVKRVLSLASVWMPFSQM